MIKQHDQLVKLILIGSSGVGKSSILTQFAQNKFSQTYLTTIGVDFRFKKITRGNQTLKLQIWDTAGQQRFRTITSAYYKGADGIIMVYDLTSDTSLEDIKQFWIPQAKNYCDSTIDVLLLGNKSDCDIKISKEKVSKIASENKYKIGEVSAKTGDRIEETIKQFALAIADKKMKKQYSGIGMEKTPTSSNVQVTKKNQSQEKKKGCC